MTKHPLMPALRCLALAVVAALAACSAEPEPVPPADAAASASPTAAPAAPSTPAAPAIPAAYRGVWDWQGGSCDPASDLRMEIGADAIVFYESVGEVLAAEAGEDSVRLELAMSGEGESWRRTSVLTLIEGGSMIETEAQDPSGTGAMRYRRCPAQP